MWVLPTMAQVICSSEQVTTDTPVAQPDPASRAPYLLAAVSQLLQLLQLPQPAPLLQLLLQLQLRLVLLQHLWGPGWRCSALLWWKQVTPAQSLLLDPGLLALPLCPPSGGWGPLTLVTDVHVLHSSVI